MANKNWQDYPAGSKERYEAAKKDPSVKVGPFMAGDYRISKVPNTGTGLTETEMGDAAKRYFGKKKAMGSDRRLFDKDPKANKVKAKYAALQKLKQKKNKGSK